MSLILNHLSSRINQPFKKEKNIKRPSECPVMAILRIQMDMKKLFAAVAFFSLLVACGGEKDNPGGSQNNTDELTITGDAQDVKDCSATLTGYANLPFELGDAEVGVTSRMEWP